MRFVDSGSSKVYVIHLWRPAHAPPPAMTRDDTLVSSDPQVGLGSIQRDSCTASFAACIVPFHPEHVLPHTPAAAIHPLRNREARNFATAHPCGVEDPVSELTSSVTS